MRKVLIDFAPGLIGGVVGGVAGYFVFGWLLKYGLFAPVFPGALTGLACGLLSRTDSVARGLLCAVEALVIGVVSEWVLMSPPFETDGTLKDYVTKIHQLPLPTLLMLALGVFLGFWWGKECTWRGRLDRQEPRARSTEGG
jgi:hypothetical protein